MKQKSAKDLAIAHFNTMCNNKQTVDYAWAYLTEMAFNIFRATSATRPPAEQKEHPIALEDLIKQLGQNIAVRFQYALINQEIPVDSIVQAPAQDKAPAEKDEAPKEA